MGEFQVQVVASVVQSYCFASCNAVIILRCEDRMGRRSPSLFPAALLPLV